MDTVYYGEDFPDTVTKSIFLAGPSLRPNQKDLVSWRKDALQILDDIGFDGTVFVPEFRNIKDIESFKYKEVVEWEDKFLNAADQIVFWVPRSKDLPGFTTNVEFGRWECSGKIVLGYPEDAEKMTYLNYYGNKYHIPIEHSLTATLQQAVDILGDGAERHGGERYIQLSIWNTKSFQNWYTSQTNAGNKLLSAKMFWLYKPNYKTPIFIWIIKPEVYVAELDKTIKSELVISRTDISTVLLWRKRIPLETSEVVLIKEYRVAGNTEDTFIREMPSGSSPSEKDSPKEAAAQEVHEETGAFIEPDRLEEHGARQLAGTFSAHRSHFFSVKLNEEELNWFKSQKGVFHGNEDQGERTLIEVYSIRDLLNKNVEIDWSTLGQILYVYYKAWNSMPDED